MNTTKKKMLEEIHEASADKALEIQYGNGKDERRINLFFDDLDKAADFINELRQHSKFAVNRRGRLNGKLGLSVDVIIGDSKEVLTARTVFLRMRNSCANFIQQGLFCQFRAPAEEDHTIRHCAMGLCPLINTVDTIVISEKEGK